MVPTNYPYRWFPRRSSNALPLSPCAAPGAAPESHAPCVPVPRITGASVPDRGGPHRRPGLRVVQLAVRRANAEPREHRVPVPFETCQTERLWSDLARFAEAVKGTHPITSSAAKVARVSNPAGGASRSRSTSRRAVRGGPSRVRSGSAVWHRTLHVVFPCPVDVGSER